MSSRILFWSGYRHPCPERKKAVLPANAEETAHFPTTHSEA